MDELKELLREKHIVLPDGLKETRLENIRRPLVLFRGKPITEEEVMELITGEESLFLESQEGIRMEAAVTGVRQCRWITLLLVIVSAEILE